VEVAMHPVQIEIYKKMSPEMKLKIAVQLNRSARELKAAYLRSIHPDWDEQQIQTKVVEIFRNAVT
jgi:Rv0078B-related antitoxin